MCRCSNWIWNPRGGIMRWSFGRLSAAMLRKDRREVNDYKLLFFQADNDNVLKAGQKQRPTGLCLGGGGDAFVKWLQYASSEYKWEFRPNTPTPECPKSVEATLAASAALWVRAAEANLPMEPMNGEYEHRGAVSKIWGKRKKPLTQCPWVAVSPRCGKVFLLLTMLSLWQNILFTCLASVFQQTSFSRPSKKRKYAGAVKARGDAGVARSCLGVRRNLLISSHIPFFYTFQHELHDCRERQSCTSVCSALFANTSVFLLFFFNLASVICWKIHPNLHFFLCSFNYDDEQRWALPAGGAKFCLGCERKLLHLHLGCIFSWANSSANPFICKK